MKAFNEDDYVKVDERVSYFVHVIKGEILTDIVRFDETLAVVKAIVYVNGDIKSTGHAVEFRDEKDEINSKNYLENAETSAVGRALGFLGIGIEGGIASKDEIKKATDDFRRQQSENRAKAAAESVLGKSKTPTGALS